MYLDSVGEDGFEGGDVAVNALAAAALGFLVADAGGDGFGFGHGSWAEVWIVGVCRGTQHSDNIV